MTDWRAAYIALGSNLGDRRAAIDGALRAIDAHEDIEVSRVSRIIETAPVGPPGQGPYLNAAAALRTLLGPRELLECFLEIEAGFGRDRAEERALEKWGPRTLDIDLLLYGEKGEFVLDEPGLTLPHPRLHERSFVLEPLAEIAGDLLHPLLKRPVHELRDALLPHDAAERYAETGGTGSS